MDLSSNKPADKKKREKPSQEQTMGIMDLIKAMEKETDEDEKAKEVERLAEEKKLSLMEKEKTKIQLAQNQVKRNLRENLKKKEKQDKIKNTKNYLEIGDTIKWKSINLSNKLEGYVKNKLVFEIKRGMTVFNLYIKDTKLITEQKIKSYQGCSVNIQKLKDKSEVLIKKRLPKVS